MPTRDSIGRPDAAGPTVGFCQISTYAYPCLAVGPTVLTCPSFELTCELHGNAGDCGPHDCGDLVLTAQGIPVVLPRAVVDGALPDSVFPGQGGYAPCFVGQTSGFAPRDADPISTPESRMGIGNDTFLAELRTEMGAGLTGQPKARVSADNRLIPIADRVWYFSGPVTIASKTHETKWKEGWFEYVFAIGFYTVYANSLAQQEASWGFTLPRVDSEDFNKYRFQLFEHKGHYY